MNRRRLGRLFAVGFLVTGSLIATPAVAEADDSICPAGNACFWTLLRYQGSKQVVGNWAEGRWAWVDPDHRNYHSVKNRFTNRAVWTAKPYQTAYCTPANRDWPTATEFTVILVGAAGSTC